MTIEIRKRVLEEAQAFLEAAGSVGREGTGMLAATSRGNATRVSRFVGPDQTASSVGVGCSVEVTEKGKLELAAALSIEELYVSRIHSHPGEAFHSGIDDRNPALTAEGVFSIVVPYFGLGLRHGLLACGVYQRVKGRWIELTNDQVTNLFEVVDD